MCDEDRRIPTNLELFQKLEAMDQKLDAHRQYVEDSFVSTTRFNAQLKSIATEVMRQVTAQMQGVFSDGIRTAGAEIQLNAQTTGHADFKRWYEEQQLADRAAQEAQRAAQEAQRSADRQARKDRWIAVANTVKSVGGYIVMFGAITNVILLWWLLVGR